MESKSVKSSRLESSCSRNQIWRLDRIRHQKNNNSQESRQKGFAFTVLELYTVLNNQICVIPWTSLVRSQVESRNFWKWYTAKRYLAILNLKPSNCWKRITFGRKFKKKQKTKIFLTPESMVEWLSPVLYANPNAQFAVAIKLFPKPKHEKNMKRLIEKILKN